MPNCECPSTQHGHAEGCSNPIEVGTLCKTCNEEAAKEFAQTKDRNTVDGVTPRQPPVLQNLSQQVQAAQLNPPILPIK
jgi:hypothetical protein